MTHHDGRKERYADRDNVGHTQGDDLAGRRSDLTRGEGDLLLGLAGMRGRCRLASDRALRDVDEALLLGVRHCVALALVVTDGGADGILGKHWSNRQRDAREEGR